MINDLSSSLVSLDEAAKSPNDNSSKTEYLVTTVSSYKTSFQRYVVGLHPMVS